MTARSARPDTRPAVPPPLGVLDDAPAPLDVLLSLARTEGKLDMLRVSLAACTWALSTQPSSTPAG